MFKLRPPGWNLVRRARNPWVKWPGAATLMAVYVALALAIWLIQDTATASAQRWLEKDPDGGT